MEKLTTGQLAKHANVNLETIRYYERRGLLPEPPRYESGHRRYTLDALRRTEFIKRTQSLGFSLNEISDLLSFRIEAGKTCADVKTRVEAKIKDVQEMDVINNYLRNGEVGKLVNSFIDIKRILGLRNKIGGQIVLCHPAKHSYIREENWIKFKKMGVDGAELLSPHHSYGAIMQIQYLSRELGFIETGGSDFHRFEGGGHTIQSSWQDFKVDSKMLRGVKDIIG